MGGKVEQGAPFLSPAPHCKMLRKCQRCFAGRACPFWGRRPSADPRAPSRAVSRVVPALSGPVDQLQTAAQIPAPFRERRLPFLGSAIHC